MKVSTKKGMLFQFLIVMLVMLSAYDTHAQRIVDVAPGEFGALNNAIDGDTTATGERQDPNTTYRLERGATYILNGSIEHSGFHLIIEAADGDGPRPLLVPGVASGESDRPFRARGDLTLRGLYITSRNEEGGLESRMIRVSADDARIEIDDCVMDEDSQTAFRLDNAGNKIYIRNSIISRMGTPDDVDNGRVLDDRGNMIDTLVIENSTMYNITSRIIRDGSGAESFIKYCKFTNNTCINVGQRLSDFGPVVEFIFTDNIIINPSFLGSGQDTIPGNDPFVLDPEDLPDPSIILDSVSMDILTDLGATQTADIRNNNIYTASEVTDARPVFNPDPEENAALVERPIWSATAIAFMQFNETMDTNIEEDPDFANEPALPLAFIQQTWDNFDGSIELDDWVNDPTLSEIDLSFPDNKLSASASTTNGQLGDLNWELTATGINGLFQALTEANDLITQATAGGNIGNHPQSAIDALQAAIDAAQAVADNAASTEGEIDAALTALTTARDAFISSVITSIGENLDRSIIAYPNPARSHINLLFNDTKARSIDVVNSLGQTVESVTVVNTNETTLDIAGWKPGIYAIRVQGSDSAIATFKIIKE
ncbi:MAG: T9SS type A sorting domain-containing protein [Bacteroidota bacterium]